MLLSLECNITSRLSFLPNSIVLYKNSYQNQKHIVERKLLLYDCDQVFCWYETRIFFLSSMLFYTQLWIINFEIYSFIRKYYKFISQSYYMSMWVNVTFRNILGTPIIIQLLLRNITNNFPPNNVQE